MWFPGKPILHHILKWSISNVVVNQTKIAVMCRKIKWRVQIFVPYLIKFITLNMNSLNFLFPVVLQKFSIPTCLWVSCTILSRCNGQLKQERQITALPVFKVPFTLLHFNDNSLKYFFFSSVHSKNSTTTSIFDLTILKQHVWSKSSKVPLLTFVSLATICIR